MSTNERIQELQSEAAAISDMIQHRGKPEPTLMDRLKEIREEIAQLEEQEDESKFLAYLDRVEAVSGPWSY